ncbi:MAG: DNA repair exonuclease [Spirochaetes bacterium]|nr:DNA repair exonuclease [Spirochaetota bacterium]
MVKILLTADVHLGSEIERLAVPEDYRLKTFKKLSFLAKSHDILIIAGDLFHENSINERTVNFASEEFKNLRDCGVEIVYTLGEHELNSNDTSLLSGLNVSKMFSDTGSLEPYQFTKDNQQIFIYGLPAYNTHDITGIKKLSEYGFHIGVFHADFYNTEENKTPKIRMIEKDDIMSLNLDFYALGHNHQFRLFKSNGRYIGAYPGSPEAVNFDENGDRYALSITIKGNEIHQIKRLTVNSLKLESFIFDCTNTGNFNSVMDVLNEKKSEGKIVKVQLTGKRNFKLDREDILKINNENKHIYIEDKSFPTINLFLEKFADEESLRGEFFNILKWKIKNNELPPEIDMDIFSGIINKIINSGSYTLEDLCSYWNA